METIGNRIKRLRRSNHIKAAELARMIGASPISVCNWEAGRHRPSPGMISKLSEVLEVSPRYIKYGEEPYGRTNQTTP